MALTAIKKRVIFFAVGITSFSILIGVLAFLWLVVFHPGDDIRPGNIEKILAIETPILYNDGVNKIGVFFEEAHRQYLAYEEIPKDFINSIVASEDRSFFSHYGIDPFCNFSCHDSESSRRSCRSKRKHHHTADSQKPVQSQKQINQIQA